MTQNNNETTNNTKLNRVPLIPSLISSIVDQIIIAAIAGIALAIFNLIMLIAQYYVSGMLQMFLIFYVLSNIIYIGVFEASKLSATPGKLLLKSKVVTK